MLVGRRRGDGGQLAPVHDADTDDVDAGSRRPQQPGLHGGPVLVHVGVPVSDDDGNVAGVRSVPVGRGEDFVSKSPESVAQVGAAEAVADSVHGPVRRGA